MAEITEEMVKRADSILEYIEVHDQDALQGITQSGSTCGWSFYSQKAVYAPGVRYTIIGQGGASETVFVDEIKDAYGGYIVTAHRIDMEAERSRSMATGQTASRRGARRTARAWPGAAR